MAGDWIKILAATPDKPEVFALAQRLGIDADAALGKLVRVWI
jgi:DNA replication protein DnaT